MCLYSTRVAAAVTAALLSCQPPAVCFPLCFPLFFLSFFCFLFSVGRITFTVKCFCSPRVLSRIAVRFPILFIAVRPIPEANGKSGGPSTETDVGISGQIAPKGYLNRGGGENIYNVKPVQIAVKPAEGEELCFPAASE